MNIHNPCLITSRLLPGITIGDTTISIEYSDRPGDGGRTRYRYYIDSPEWEHSDDDLQSGGMGGGLQSGLESLLSFLDSEGERYQYVVMRKGYDDGDGWLFGSEQIAEWCYCHSDELAMARMELEETPGIIDE